MRHNRQPCRVSLHQRRAIDPAGRTPARFRQPFPVSSRLNQPPGPAWLPSGRAEPASGAGSYEHPLRPLPRAGSERTEGEADHPLSPSPRGTGLTTFAGRSGTAVGLAPFGMHQHREPELARRMRRRSGAVIRFRPVWTSLQKPPGEPTVVSERESEVRIRGRAAFPIVGAKRSRSELARSRCGDESTLAYRCTV